MKNYISIFAAALCSLLLTSCKSEIGANVNTSYLYEPIKEYEAKLAIEVPSCNDYQNKELESSSLLEAKQKIAYYLPKSKFEKCHRSGFESFAVFTYPIKIGKLENMNELDNDSIFLISDMDSKIFMITGDSMAQKIQQMADKTIGGLELKIHLYLKNDLDDLNNLSIFNSYIRSGNESFPVQDFTLSDVKKGLSFEITIGDVSSSLLWNKIVPNGKHQSLVMQLERKNSSSQENKQ